MTEIGTPGTGFAATGTPAIGATAAAFGAALHSAGLPVGPDRCERLPGQIATAVGRLRSLDLTKPPGISEAISWAFAVSVFGAAELDAPVAGQTLSTVLKYPEDEESVRRAGLASVVGRLD